MKTYTYRAMMASALVGVMMVCGAAQAATYYWDTDGITGGFGNTAGTWGTSAFWSTDITGASATALTTITTGDGVNFGTATLALSGASTNVGVAASGVTVNSITFGAGQTTPIVLGTVGNTITLGGTTPTITVNNSADTINSIIVGGPLTKAGTGALTMGAINTYSGETVISQGTLKLAGVNAVIAPPVAGSVLWLDATKGVTTNSSGKVTSWTDQSGKGNNATGGTTTGPTLTTINGLQALNFTGSQYLSGGIVNGSSVNLSIFIVHKDTSIVNLAAYLDTPGWTSGSMGIMQGSSKFQYSLNPSSDRTGNASLQTTSAVLDEIIDANGAKSFYLNGTANGTFSDGANVTKNMSSFNIGAWSSGTMQRYLNGSIGELLIYTNALSTSDRQVVESYLSAKWLGAVNILPSATTLQIANGAKLDLYGTTQIIASLADGSGGGGSVTNSATSTPLTLTIDNGSSTASNTFSGAFNDIGAAGAISLVKKGSGTQVLSGNNTYAGATTISAGTLKAGSITGLSANSAFSVAAGAFLDLGGYNNTIKSLGTDTATSIITNSTGSATLKVSSALGSSTLLSHLFTGSLAVQITGANNTIAFANAGNTYSGGTILGNGSGGNTRVLFGGGTIGSGTPGALTSGKFGTGAITLGVNTTDLSQFMFQFAGTVNNAFVVNTTLGQGGSDVGAFRIDTTGDIINGTINANLAAIQFRNNGSGAGAISLNNTIFGNSGLTLLTSAASATSLNVTLANTGTVNSYAGDTTISSVKETLILGAANQIPNGSGKGNVVITGGTFSMGGFSETINGLSGSGIVDGVSGTPTLTVGDNDATSTYSGVIKNSGGTLALIKTGNGTLALSGVNTYGGNTTINAGRLQGVVGGGCTNSTVILNATTATNSVSITDNTKAWTNAALTVSSAGVLEFTFGSFTPSTTVSPLKITGAAAFTATPTVYVVVNSGLASGTYPLMTWGSTSGTVPTTANLTASLPAGATGSLSVSGNTLNLVISATAMCWDNNGATEGFGTAAGIWASPTIGNFTQGWSWDGTGSTLPIDKTTTLNDPVSFGNGGTGLGTGTITVSGVVTNGNMTFATGSGVITLSGGIITFPADGAISVNNTSNAISSVLAGAGTSLTKTGPGILTLSGNNTYKGVTSVSEGTLNLTGQDTNSSIIVNNSAVFTEAASGVIAGTNTFTQSSSGTSILGGTNTYSGATTISSGTLKAGSTSGFSANSAFSVAAGATLDLGGFNNTIQSLSTATGTITNSGSTATLKIMTMGSTAQLFTGNLGLQVNNNQGIDLTNTGNTFSGGTTLGFGVGSNTRILLSWRTIGVGTPGALTSGQFGTGAIILGAAANDYSQLLLMGASTINNAIVVNSALGNSDAAGTFRVDTTGNVINGTLTANLANATFRNNGGTGSFILNGSISGNFGVMLSASAGTGLSITMANTSLVNTNSYAGDTIISSVKETLTLGAANQIPNGTGKGNLINNGTFNLGGFSETINGLSGSGIVDGVSGSPTLTVGDNDATGTTNTFAGVIKNTAGILSLTKIGSGTLTLSGTSTYSGSTGVSNGTLSVNGALTNANITVATGATLTGTGTICCHVSASTNDLITVSGTATLSDLTLALDVQGFLPVGSYVLANGLGSTQFKDINNKPSLPTGYWVKTVYRDGELVLLLLKNGTLVRFL
ncbi:MAG: autotransporter-associated beta strand repeat-containing protein [bacterium]